MVREIQSQMSSIDPVNAARYESNAKKTEARLDALVTEIEGELAGLQGSEFISFHDAYQYFENRFGVKAIGTVTVSPEVMPGAKRLKELREKVKSSKATCVFSEPQFEPKVVEVITDGTGARTGVLDPLGSELKPGANLYPTLIRRMAKALKDCLSS
jgi:zinc transport system substrate-binding protein